MESRVKYTVVGIFVFIVGFLLASFIFWIGKYGNESVEYDWYKIMMKDSVSGLNQESPVKFRGVEVGQVQNIGINTNNSEEVEILIRIKKDTPIKKDSLAVVSSLGITGLSYIELKGGSNNSKRLFTTKETPSVIQSGSSLFSRLENSAFDVTDRLDDTLQRVQLLMSDKNLLHLQNLLQNLDSLSLTLNEKTQKILSDENADKIAHIIQRLEKISDALDEKKIQTLLEKTVTTEDKVIELFSTLENTTREFNTTLSRGDYNFNKMTEQSRLHLNELLIQMKSLGYDMQEVLHQLKRSPSDIFFKRETKELGPGEK